VSVVSSANIAIFLPITEIFNCSNSVLCILGSVFRTNDVDGHAVATSSTKYFDKVFFKILFSSFNLYQILQYHVDHLV
jgi:hypothetical protein